MINIEKARQFFNEYASRYINDVKNSDKSDEDKQHTLDAIKLKIGHMLRVTKSCHSIAERLNLSDEDVKLAELIGLLHDIGRFEQLKEYDTFDDTKSIRHDLYSVVQLFNNDKIIKHFIDVEDDKVDPVEYYIISRAVYNHGRKEIEQRDFSDTDEIDPTTKLFCGIIRDADKMDIYYQCVNRDPYVVFNGSRDYKAKSDPSTGKLIIDGSMNPKVFSDFMSHRPIDNKDVVTQVDDLARKFAFVFDFNFSESLEEVIANEYISKMLSRFKESFILTEEAVRAVDAVAAEAERYIHDKMEKTELLRK